MISKKIIPLRSDYDYYGASYVASRYCGLGKPLYTGKRISWQHGWIPQHRNVHPYLVVPGVDCHIKERLYLVAREDQKEFLLKNGYYNVAAVGLPIVYLENVDLQRKANSLLVMPVHSLDYTDHNHWGFAKYAEEINSIRGNFEEVAICIHPSCIKKGYWVKEFERYGFKIIEGASVDDKNALYRLQSILNSYEYVTTNGLGSHIAYAAYFGAKVSIYGEFAEFKKEDFATDPFYSKFPEVLDEGLKLISKKNIEESFPDLFVFPKNAIEKVEWANNELGFYNKVSPSKLKRILGWDLRSRIQNKGNTIKRKLYGKLKQFF